MPTPNQTELEDAIFGEEDTLITEVTEDPAKPKEEEPAAPASPVEPENKGKSEEPPSPVSVDGVDPRLAALAPEVETAAPPAQGKESQSDPLEEIPEEPPSGKKAGSAWKQARDTITTQSEELKALRDEKAKLEEQLASAPKVDADADADVEAGSQKIQALEAELKEAKQIINQVRFEATDEYKKNIAEPLQEHERRLASMIRRNEADSTSINEALSITDPVDREDKLREIAVDWDPADRVRLEDMAGSIFQLRQKKSELIKDPEEALNQIMAEQQKIKDQARQQYYQKTDQAYDQQWKKFPEENPIFRELPTNTDNTEKNKKNAEWNEVRTKIFEQAKQIETTPLEPEQRAEHNFRAAAYPALAGLLKDTYVTMSQEINSLRSRLEDYEGGKPPAGGRETSPTASKQKGADWSGSTDKAADELAAGLF